MITLNDFSFLLVTRCNSVERLYGVYQSIRRFYPSNEIVIIYDDVVSENLEKKITDPNLKEIHTLERVYVSGGYNLALKHCSNKCFVFLHDDTFVAKNFLENLVPHVTETQFCNFTTIEPPVYNSPDSIAKPIKDFGRDMSMFNIKLFDVFCDTHIKKIQNPIIDSPYGGFFMAGFKSSIESVGAFDENFKPYFYEDSDLMTRLHMNGYKFVQVLNSLVYHMGSLTSRGTEESVIAHNTTHAIFLKKWKVPFDMIKRYSMDGGIPYKHIPVEIEHVNCAGELLKFIDLINEPGSEIKVHIDATKLINDDLDYIQSFCYILQSIDSPGQYEIGNLKITYTPHE